MATETRKLSVFLLMMFASGSMGGPSCSSSVISDLSSIPLLSVASCDFSYGGVCNFQCPPDYTLIGGSSLQCGDPVYADVGRWIGDCPLGCTKFECDPLVVDNGTVNCDDGENLGSVCNVTCDEGFEAIKSTSAECVYSYDIFETEWEFEGWGPIECKRLQCPKIHLAFGHVNCTNSWHVGSVCTFSCDEDFLLGGDDPVECIEESLATVRWDDVIPTCVPC